jgi:transcription antitermination factor NusG
MSEVPQWHAVRTRSNYERKFSASLSKRGVENYLPMFQEVHQWKDRKKGVELPIFPGYLFVRIFDSRESRLSVLSGEGTVGILSLGEKIEPIPASEIEAVRQFLSSSGRGFRVHPLLREGAWVQVRRGALKGIEGMLVRVKSQTRLVLSITRLSQSVSTEIDASDVHYLFSSGPPTSGGSSIPDARDCGLAS